MYARVGVKSTTLSIMIRAAFYYISILPVQVIEGLKIITNHGKSKQVLRPFTLRELT